MNQHKRIVQVFVLLSVLVLLYGGQKQEEQEIVYATKFFDLEARGNIEPPNHEQILNELKNEIKKDIFNNKLPTEEDVKSYLDMSIGQITWLTGQEIDDIKNGTQMVFSFAAFYSIIDPDMDCPFYFLCSTKDPEQRATYVCMKSGYDRAYLSYIGLDIDMDFNDIMDQWGETEIVVTSRGWEIDDWSYYEYHYLISYERNGLVYEFVSWHEDGKYFSLYIKSTRPYWD